MNLNQLFALKQLARLHGIQLSYLSMSGQEQEASPESLLAALKALGAPLDGPDQIRDALRAFRQRSWTQGVEPVSVAWIGKKSQVELRLPARLNPRQIGCRLFLERQELGEEAQTLRLLSSASRVQEVEGISYAARRLPLPDLPPGYHRLEVETPQGRFESLVLAAPVESYSEPGQPRQWGVFLPLYAAHSRQSWGAGHFGDWRLLTQWVGSLGGGLVGSLPLLAAFLDYPVCEPGPYSPASRLFWNEFFIDINQVPEFATCAPARRLVNSPAFQQKLQSLRRARLVNYCEEMAAKRQVLELLALEFFSRSSPRQQEFRRYLRARPRAEDYARFRAACEQARLSWHTWPERMKNGKLRSGDYDPAVANYYLYAQWQAEQQIDSLIQEGRSRGVKLYLDLPLGVNPDSYDIWREREAFTFGVSVGAPPDSFFTKGQDWGFAPLHPQRLRDQGYQYVLDYLRFQMRHTQLLRIDHVMGLHRLYWIPPGMPATQGVYVRYAADELYALLSLESHRHQTTLVGENLGTVPPEVNASMQRHRLRQMYVVQYAQRPDPKAALETPAHERVASLNTHDMPTFAAHWNGLDILDRASLGLVQKKELPQLRRTRKASNEALAQFLRREGYLARTSSAKSHSRSSCQNKLAEAHLALRACLEWLSRSPAETVLINLEDLWLEELPQNVPGTSHERPNWRRKTRWTLDRIMKDPQIREVLEAVNRLREQPTYF